MSVIEYGFNNNVWNSVIFIYGGAGGNIDIKSSPGLMDVVNKQTKLDHAKPVDSEVSEESVPKTHVDDNEYALELSDFDNITFTDLCLKYIQQQTLCLLLL